MARRSLPRRAACAALVLGLALVSAPALAQSCCGVVAGDEMAVVPPYERAVFVSQVSAKHMFGRHDSEGAYQPLADDVSATDLQLALGGGFRFPFYDRLQLHGGFSGRLQHRTLPGLEPESTESATALGPGDLSLSLRWSLLYDDRRGLFLRDASGAPWLDVFVGTKAPTGRYQEGPAPRDLARTMGDGTWGVSGGVRAIKYLTPGHAARLSLRYDARLVRDADQALTGHSEFSPGDQVGLAFGYLGVRRMRWMYGLTATVTFTRTSRAREPGADFRELRGTEMRETTLAANVTRVLIMPQLDLSMSVVYTLPLPQLSQNLSWEGVQGGLSLRYHVL